VLDLAYLSTERATHQRTLLFILTSAGRL